MISLYKSWPDPYAEDSGRKAYNFFLWNMFQEKDGVKGVTMKYFLTGEHFEIDLQPSGKRRLDQKAWCVCYVPFDEKTSVILEFMLLNRFEMNDYDYDRRLPLEIFGDLLYNRVPGVETEIPDGGETSLDNYRRYLRLLFIEDK